MQEELCSFRLLIFIHDQVYFQCRRSTRDEDAAGSGSFDGGDFVTGDCSLMYSVFEEPVDFVSFENLMLYYLRRDLTCQSDILRACHGMLRKLADAMGEKLIGGLPTPLERSLLFSRDQPIDQSGFRRQGFPSYSWTGWKHISQWERDLKYSHFEDRYGHRLITQENAEQNWITWYKWSSDDKLHEISEHENKEPLARIEEHLTDNSQLDFSTAVAPYCLAQLPNLAYDILCFRTISVFLRMSLVQPSADSQSDGRCLAYGLERTSFGQFNLDANDIDFTTVQEFALVSGYKDTWDNRAEVGWWGILLRRTGPLAERRGILRIQEKILNKTLPPGPLWTNIFLG